MKLLVKTRNVTGIKRKRALCGQKIQRRDGTYVELEGWVKLGQAERWGKADGIHEHRYGHSIKRIEDRRFYLMNHSHMVVTKGNALVT